MGTLTQVYSRIETLERWLPYCRPENAQSKVRLLCFAHAGGTASVFHKWAGKFPSTVQLCGVQLPGRERRLNDPFIRRMPQLIDELLEALLPWIDRPVALLGHSLGAKIAFEFARRIRARSGSCEIVHLFVSGSRAPHLPPINPPIYNLPAKEFIQRLGELGGTVPEVLSNPELMEFLSPRLRSDFELNYTYEFESQQALPCPITAWVGNGDSFVSLDSLEAWRQHTLAQFQVHVLEGTHFALYERESEVLPRVIDALTHLL